MSKAPKTERLLALLLLLLEKQSPLSRSDIREMVKDYPPEVSDAAFEKMFERDKEELRSLGFPVETVVIVETEGSGYVLSNRDVQLEPIEFTAPEKAALSLATRLWSGSVNRFDATHALKKLESSAEGERFESTAALNYVSQDATVQLDLLRSVDTAVANEQVVKINYTKPGESEPLERTVSPWGIVMHSGTSYLVAHDHLRDAVRTFKLARIGALPKTADGELFVSAGDADPQAIVSAAIADVLDADELDTQLRKVLLTGTSSQDVGEELRAAVDDAITKARAAQVELDALKAAGQLEKSIAELAKARKAAARKAPQDSSTQFTRILAIVPWLVQHQGVPTDVAAREFGISTDQLVKDLNLAFCTEYGFDNVAMDFYISSTLQVWDPKGIESPLRFSATEAYALQLGLLRLQQLPGLVDTESIVSAQEKLSAGTGISAGAVQVTPADQNSVGQLLQQTDQAIADSEILELQYQGSLDSGTSTRRVEPRSVSSVDGHNYLVAWCLEAEGVRRFRFDRIHGLTVTGDRFDPTVRQAAEAETRPLGTVTEFATLRVNPSVAWWADTIYDTIAVDSFDGTQLVSVPLGSPEWLIKSVVGFAGEIQIVDPPALVDNFHDYLKRPNPL